MVELFANSEQPDQTPRFAASDLGLHCLPVTRLGISSLQRVNALLMSTHIRYFRIVLRQYQYVFVEKRNLNGAMVL